MSDQQEAEKRRDVDPDAFPSLALALEEIRQNYLTEQDRKSNIEVRIGAIVGIDALLVSLVGVFGQMHWLTRASILIPALVAGGYGLAAFSSREYRKPGPEADEIFGYARKEEGEATKAFIQNYRRAINHNNARNNERMDTLDRCFKLTALSFIFILLSPALDAAIFWIGTLLRWLAMFV
jgi:hypothetical protein